ncbi:hypothetical protein ACF1GW_09840 [Streptomyces achromogenes]|uniref:hypothetical protein n=1 Tax=Streptomyces achromogenes TaxID=67255 RepID=UPI0036F883B7
MIGWAFDACGALPTVSQEGENVAMAVCKRCGERKRRWPRSCSRCDSGWDRAETTADVTDVVVETGMLGWVGRGVAGVARLVVRALD